MGLLILSLLAWCLLATGEAFKDGDSYKITSVADGNALAVNSSGFTLLSEPWLDGATQKWLAIEAIVATDAYLLVPHRQTWDWAKFTAAGTKDRREQLPDNTMVIAYDSSKGQLIQESYIRSGGKAQQWQSTSLGHDRFLIKNLMDGKCLVNLGELKPKASLAEKVQHKMQKLVGKKKSHKAKPGVLELQDCVSTDDKHLWRLEALPAGTPAPIVKV